MNPVLLHHLNNRKKLGAAPKRHLSIRIPDVRAATEAEPDCDIAKRDAVSPITPNRKRKLPALAENRFVEDEDAIEPRPLKSPKNGNRRLLITSPPAQRSAMKANPAYLKPTSDKAGSLTATECLDGDGGATRRAQPHSVTAEGVKQVQNVEEDDVGSQPQVVAGAADPSVVLRVPSLPNEIRDTDSEMGDSGADIEKANVVEENVTMVQNQVAASDDNDSEYNEEFGEELPDEFVEDEGRKHSTLTQVRPVDLKSLLRVQETTLKQKNNELFHHRTDIFRRPKERMNSAAFLTVHSLQRMGNPEVVETDSPRKLWRSMVDDALARDPGYFTSSSARMEEATPSAGRGSATYPGLKVNRNNCHDLDSIYTMRFRAKELMSVSSGASFQLLQTIVGQFLRWCISSKQMPKEDGWKKKALFTQIGKEKLVQVFINHFMTTSAPSTVASKCNALQIVAKCAALKFSNKNTQIRIGRVSLYLKTACNAAKCGYREKARNRQSADERIQNQTLVTAEQTQKGVNLAHAVLWDIMDSFTVESKKKGQQKAMGMFEKSPSLVDKWCLNFLGLVTLSGGGQRPQAYARLKCPERAILDLAYDGKFSEDETFSLKTFREKTARALDMPDVVFPNTCLSFFAFHVDFMRPLLIGKRCHEPSDIFLDNDPLLLHSRTGKYMTPSNISTSIRRFMVSVDPRLTNVTAMTLRASYATSMLHNYRQGVFKDEGLTEDEFLDLDAKQMNTSVEQLRNTYMATHSKDFKQAMRLFTGHFTYTMNEKDDEKDVYVERGDIPEIRRSSGPSAHRASKQTTTSRRFRNQNMFENGVDESDEDRELENRALFPDEVEDSQ